MSTRTKTSKTWTRSEEDRLLPSRMMGHLATDCRRNGQGKAKCGDGGKGHVKGKGKTIQGTGKNDSGKFGGSKRGGSREQKGLGYQGRCWTCCKIRQKSAESRWRVACVDEEDSKSRSMNRREMEKSKT